MNEAAKDDTAEEDNPAKKKTCTAWVFPDLSLNVSEEAWQQPPSIWDVNEQDSAKVRWPTAAELESLRKSAYDEGFHEGRREGALQGKTEGLKAAEHEIQQKASSLGEIIAKLMQPIDRRDEDVVTLLVSFIVKFSRQVIQRELAHDASSLKQIVSEALNLLPIDAQQVKIQLNPKDLAWIQPWLLQTPEYQPEWKLYGDAKTSQGGCVVETQSMRIDASIEKRMAELIERLYQTLSEHQVVPDQVVAEHQSQ